ncbi:uncharacterized protein [Coffea arabica]|uniref:Reverse transcriptase domain-containing protein n=1 Tax=Coffea arabica TaxID=13443 RepID=A0ABM4X7L3_COFAR
MGVSKPPNLRRLKNLIRLHKVQLVAICEPKLDVTNIESIRLNLSFDAAVVNLSADVWVLYNFPLVCSIAGNSQQHISLNVHHPWLPRSLRFSFVHARCTLEERRGLWQALLVDKPRDQPWCICGDFNVIISPSEKKGDRPFRVSERLELLTFMEEAEVFYVVSREAEASVLRAEARVETEASENAQIELHRSQAQLNRALSVEEEFWKQKARVKWLRHGDCNSKFFHATLRQRRMQGQIHRIKDETGIWVKTDEDISREAIRYFSDLFSAPAESSSDLLHVIPANVTAEENMSLEADPSFDEVKRTIFAMDGDSAASPDGFMGKLFTFAWEVIGQDVYNAVLSFFCRAELPHFITSTSIVLLPKGPNPQDFLMFRPINLCNFFNKVLSKILADRLANILPRIVSPQHTGFVKGRNISENYFLAQEIMSGMRRSYRGGNVALKLDMSKAYDHVSWVFLMNVMRQFGFGERFLDMVWRLISNAWFSVIINEASYGFFKSGRGLRQGDPISPALFVIGAELLSQALNNLVLHCGYRGFKVPRGCPQVTYLAFADDVLIFANGFARALQDIVRVLELYQQSSGQLVNRQKNGYIVHLSASIARRRVIEHLTGFSRQQAPIRYLGFPLYLGQSKAYYYGEVSQAIIGRILSWKSKFLSQGGKIILIKHVLSSIPLHLLSAAVMPTSVFRVIKKWKFRTGTSLWARFLRAKYYGACHPCQVELKVGVSATWKRIINVSREAELSMRWLVNAGTCDFWYDNWLGNGALFLKAPVQGDLSFRDFIVDGKWNSVGLAEYLPRDITTMILQHSTPEGERPDEVVWVSTTSGSFSLSSAFREVRQARNPSWIFSHIWLPQLPVKVSLFMLRLLMRRLPLDDILGKFGFQLPSKCFCSSMAAAAGESIEHIFSTGQLAVEIWGVFGSSCGICLPAVSLRERLVAWWLSPHSDAQRRHVVSILPSFICWHIWKARNKAIFEGVELTRGEICHGILRDIFATVEIKFRHGIVAQTFDQFCERLS